MQVRLDGYLAESPQRTVVVSLVAVENRQHEALDVLTNGPSSYAISSTNACPFPILQALDLRYTTQDALVTPDAGEALRECLRVRRLQSLPITKLALRCEHSFFTKYIRKFKFTSLGVRDIELETTGPAGELDPCCPLNRRCIL